MMTLMAAAALLAAGAAEKRGALLFEDTFDGTAVDETKWGYETGWMKGKVGAFCHFLPDASTFPRLGEFDVKGLVADLRRMKPDYFMITLG